jgi:hypothetical protein
MKHTFAVILLLGLLGLLGFVGSFGCGEDGDGCVDPGVYGCAECTGANRVCREATGSTAARCGRYCQTDADCEICGPINGAVHCAVTMCVRIGS